MIGSFPYVAPEVIESGEVTPLSDVWAVGCIGYELCTGLQLPHTRGHRVIDAQNIEDYAQNIALSEIPSKFGVVMRRTIRDCLTWDPSTRPPARRVLNDIMSKLNGLDIEACETCCVLPVSDSHPIATSKVMSIEQLDDEIEGSDDGWMLLSSHFNSGHSSEAEPTRSLESTPSAGLSTLLQQLRLDVDDMSMDQCAWTTREEATLTQTNN